MIESNTYTPSPKTIFSLYVSLFHATEYFLTKIHNKNMLYLIYIIYSLCNIQYLLFLY